MITDRGKEYETITKCHDALEDRTFVLAVANTVGIDSGKMLKKLCKSYMYWANHDSDAFKMVDNVGFGFPFTNKMLEEGVRSGLLGDARLIRDGLESYGLLNTRLVPTSGNRNVNYYILHPNKISYFIMGCTNIEQNQKEELHNLRMDIEKAKNTLKSTEIAVDNFIEESITAFMLTAEENEGPKIIEEP